ncbi:CLUMA_CG021599, isoform A [Clunio marinus]|uniref:CLUMA_CG021599, isoform A n=1 Tax=Clunio marinus TaxID=568069 RepID=A0A1J1JBP6_9DIPT|nr:CLUMA_CG021599, isoform A [Clunio marinus]
MIMRISRSLGFFAIIMKSSSKPTMIFIISFSLLYDSTFESSNQAENDRKLEKPAWQIRKNGIFNSTKRKFITSTSRLDVFNIHFLIPFCHVYQKSSSQ